MTHTQLAGTTAVVTGASRGFGRAISEALVAEGALVVGIARGAADLDAVRAALGPSFTPVVADLTDPDLAARIVAEHRPRTLVLNAGATPTPAPVHRQTWSSFSRNWEVDVQHVFHFVREALVTPLQPGSVVVSGSSGAALAGSPLSGGYAGSKAAIRFLSAYAAGESERASLGIRFVSVLPQLTPATELGSAYVDAYAERAGRTRAEHLAAVGLRLTTDQVGAAVVDLVTDPSRTEPAFLVTPDGLRPLEG